MRTLIISDVHANLIALEAVLRDAEPFDQVWCLGDVVGYGPNPNECVERIRDLQGVQCIKGNHDAAIIGDIDIRAFNYEARASLEWLDTVLKPENRQWLTNLPDRLVLDDMTLVHGSPRNPVWEYILDKKAAWENMTAFDTKVCLVGHTHIPCSYQLENGDALSVKIRYFTPGKTFTVDLKSIVNPGSVGQPRDHNPKASYLIFNDETEEWVYQRVDYDIKQVQKQILAAGLPHRHASRLTDGW